MFKKYILKDTRYSDTSHPRKVEEVIEIEIPN